MQCVCEQHILICLVYLALDVFTLKHVWYSHPYSYHFVGAANPTIARRNMTLPGENGQNLVEWRFRKEQTRGKVIVFGRKLRVSAVQLKPSIYREH